MDIIRSANAKRMIETTDYQCRSRNTTRRNITTSMILLLLSTQALLVGAKVTRNGVGARRSLTSTNGTTFVNSRVNVHIPSKPLHDPDGAWNHVKSDFGFGGEFTQGSVNAFVYFIDGPACGPIPTRKPTSDNSSIVPPAVYPLPKDNDVTPYFEPPFILMLRSTGPCSPVAKIRYGQSVGAAAVVLAHDQCQCDDTVCTGKYGKSNCMENPAFLPNDGSAGDITIPSFLLYKFPADDILDQLVNHNQTVLMELTWGLMPVEADQVSSSPIRYHLWMTAHDSILDHETMEDLRVITKAFTPEQALFAPHYSVLDGSRFDCVGNTGENGPCDNLCTNHGRYCTVHSRRLSGFVVLKETLRQLCLWKHFAEQVSYDDNGNPSKGPGNLDAYWDYVIYHRIHCSGPEAFTAETCIGRSYEFAKIPVDHAMTSKIIDDCMHDSGDVTSDGENDLLQKQMELQIEYGIVNFPAITVHKHQLMDGSAENLFSAICGYYWSLSVMLPHYPEICDKCGTCTDVIGCIENGGKCIASSGHEHHDESRYDDNNRGSSSNQRRRRRHGWFWTLFFLGLIGAAYYYYVKRNGYTFNPTSSDRAGLLNTYFQLGGGD